MTRWRATVAVALGCTSLGSAVEAAAPVRISLARQSLDAAPSDPTHDSLLIQDANDPAAPVQLHQHDGARLRRADAFRRLRDYPRNKTVKLENYGNVQYVGRVAFGNPPQVLTMVFDTGSSDTWVPSTDCTSCGSHTLFSYADSTTFLDTQEKFIDAYGSGSVAGTVAVDTVMLGKYKVDSVKFGVVSQETEKLQAFMADGIFGMGFEGLAQISRPTLFTSLATQNPDIDNMFAFYLTPDAYRAGSELHIGGFDLSVVGPNASFHYTPVVKLPEFDVYMYWTVEMNHFSTVRNETVNLCTPFCYAIVDTGTSLISIPEGQYASVLAVISEGLSCDGVVCQDVGLEDFPTLKFGMVPDNMFQLQPRDYVECFGWGQCRLQLQSTADEWWILGDVFIKTYYTLFDAQNMRVGFACDGEVCTGGRGDIYGGGYDDGYDPFFQALENAFLIGSCFAAACMFLFVFYMNQQDESDDAAPGSGYPAHPRGYDGQNDPKMPLLHDGGDITSPRGGYVAPHATLVDLNQRRPPTAPASSYEEARRNFSALPSPHSYQQSLRPANTTSSGVAL